MQKVHARLQALVSTMSTFCGIERTTGVCSQYSARLTAVFTAWRVLWTSCSFIVPPPRSRGGQGRHPPPRHRAVGDRFRQPFEVPPEGDDHAEQQVDDRRQPEI